MYHQISHSVFHVGLILAVSRDYFPEELWPISIRNGGCVFHRTTKILENADLLL